MGNVLQNLATEARPLNELLEKTRKWKWADQCDAAFENIKKLVASDQVLIHYDRSSICQDSREVQIAAFC
jgi:hypothetical protein